MLNETPIQKPIEKPWAIYHLVPSIVKIIQDAGGVAVVKDSECPKYQSQFSLTYNTLERFDTLNEAIEDFCRHYCQPKEKIVRNFLEDFPSEEPGFLRLFVQRKPKCTRSRESSLGSSDTWFEPVGPGFQEYHK
jgi:hypothetical protein